MKHLKKLTMMLALLITTATGAWAQAPYTVTFKANGMTKVFENVTFPHTFQCDIAYENGELDQVIRELYSIEKGFATYEPITVRLGSTNVSAGYDGTHPFVTINDAFEGSTFVSGDYNVELLQPNPYTGDEEWMVAYQQSYTLEITCEKVDLILNDAQTVANVWMPANNMTVSYDLVRDMLDEQNPVTFGGLPTDGNIVVKKGTDGKYQPAGDFAITLLDGTQDIITNEDINVQVIIQKENELGAIDDDPDKEPITLTAFLSDMTPGYYRLKAEASENGAYDGTVYSTYLTVEEKYNLLVKPANDFSAGKLDAVTVGGTAVSPDIKGEVTGIAPDTEVKLNAKHGYVIEKVEAKKTVIPMLNAATTEDIGMVVCNKGHLHDAKTAVPDACTAVGILGKVTETGHGLILALKDATNQNWNTINGWLSASYAGTTLKVLPDDAVRGINLTSYTALGETTVSNWAVAQKSDYEEIFTNLGSTKNSGGMTYDNNVNAYITTGVGGTAMSGTYWSATQDDDSDAWYFQAGSWYNEYKTDTWYVRPVLGF